MRRKAAEISGEEAGRKVLADLCLLQRNKKEKRAEEAGRLAPETLADMLYGLPMQADVNIYNEYRQLHGFFSQVLLLLVALNRGAKLAAAQNHQELLMQRLYKDYEAEEALLRFNVTQFTQSMRASAAYNTLISLYADALALPELEYLLDIPVIEHLDPYNKLAEDMFPADPPLLVPDERLYKPSRQAFSRAQTALRSPKLTLVPRVEKALARLLEQHGAE